ncbi:hypothetical protein P7C73_g536, partial [Tremellales sp. Uapishka_1]
MSDSGDSNGLHELKDKTLIVVFGASGDVARKYTYPSLFALYNDDQLPPKTRIIGYARSDLKEDKFFDQVTGGLGDDVDKAKLEEFKKMNQYVRGAYDKDEAFQNLEGELQKSADKEFDGESNRVYYLALPPSQFTTLAQKIKKNNHTGMTNRLVIEKPFGKDTDSCRDMMDQIKADWEEDEIYRIDHFLGEEMVRSILHLRFANEYLIEPLLNNKNVSAVKIELREDFGCEGRGGYFDEYGCIRDITQNHLLQVATLLAMEKPKTTHGDAIRDEKVRVLKAMRPADKAEAVVGQYTSGTKPGYLDDESVENKKSKTETFATTVLRIDNDRWKGVPFIMMAGKALEQELCRVSVQFKAPEQPLFGSENHEPTELRIEMLPEQKVYFAVQTKQPGLEETQTSAEIALQYKTAFPNGRIPDGYETVLRAVLKGDQTTFVRDDELLASWEVFTPLLHYLEGKDGPSPVQYKYGSTGPKEAIELEQKVGFVHIRGGLRQTQGVRRISVVRCDNTFAIDSQPIANEAADTGHKTRLLHRVESATDSRGERGQTLHNNSALKSPSSSLQPLPKPILEEVQSLFADEDFVRRVGGEEIAHQALCTLKPAQWLSSDVINIYASMINKRSSLKSSRARCVNTFVYEKMAKRGYADGRLDRWNRDSQIDYDTLRVLLVPIHLNDNHWALAAINLDLKRFEYHDSLPFTEASAHQVLQVIKDFLSHELKDKKEKLDSSSWQEVFDRTGPVQPNAYDCGVWVCQWMEMMSRGLDLIQRSFSDATVYRDLMAFEIGKGELESRDGEDPESFELLQISSARDIGVNRHDSPMDLNVEESGF